MSYLIVSIAALCVAALTLFSGFGLGTLLMPVFVLFFPVKLAVAVTAVVHLANNLFKLALVGRWANRDVVIRFAVPAGAAAVLGALLLSLLAGIEPIHEYRLAGQTCVVTAPKLIIAALIVGFTVMELATAGRERSFDRKYIPLGGLLSGFFGGLSGHQGALRTAFLIRCGLDKQQLLGTMVVSAVVVDVSRLLVYGATIFTQDLRALQSEGRLALVAVATFAAFAGSFIGSRLVEKVALRTVHRLVAVLLLLIAGYLALGVEWKKATQPANPTQKRAEQAVADRAADGLPGSSFTACLPARPWEPIG